MRQNKKRFSITAVIAFIFIFTVICASFSVSAKAEPPYQGYYYDKWGDARPAPNGYAPVKSLTAREIGIPNFGTVNDMASDNEGFIYILDSDNNVIYRLDSELRLNKKITLTDNGNAVDFGGANGMTVSEYDGQRRLYIADTMHERVLIADENGSIIKEIYKPKTDLISSDQTFAPIKLCVAEDGSIYALCQQMYDGAVLINSDGKFLGFFGSNKVEMSASVLSDFFWKNLLGEKLREKFSRYVPREYTNMTIDSKGFVYTTTLVTSSSSTQIRRLNWKSNNILESTSFGDSDNSYGTNKFIDIVSMRDGLFAALDTNRGRIFIYADDGTAVTVFGGKGAQNGTFQIPVAIEAVNDDIYVYDQSTKKITVFSPTEYGENLLAATRLFLKGNYEDAEPLWKNVLKENNGYEKAYISIGRNLVEKKQYEKAMSYFKAGGSKSDYSDAKQQVRSINMRKWFPLYALAAVGVLAAFFVLLKNKRASVSDYEIKNDSFASKLKYALFHPNKGAAELACKCPAMNIATPIIMLMMFAVSVMKYQFTGFIFNGNEPGKMDILSLFVTDIGLFIIAVIANWLVITMAEGKGKLFEIGNVLAFSLIPAIAAEIIKILLSNILVENETMLLQIVSIIGYGWSVILLLSALAKVHDFTFGRNIAMTVITVVAMLIILVLLLLFYSIVKQIELFIISILTELKTML